MLPCRIRRHNEDHHRASRTLVVGDVSGTVTVRSVMKSCGPHHLIMAIKSYEVKQRIRDKLCVWSVHISRRKAGDERCAESGEDKCC